MSHFNLCWVHITDLHSLVPIFLDKMLDLLEKQTMHATQRWYIDDPRFTLKIFSDIKKYTELVFSCLHTGLECRNDQDNLQVLPSSWFDNFAQAR